MKTLDYTQLEVSVAEKAKAMSARLTTNHMCSRVSTSLLISVALPMLLGLGLANSSFRCATPFTQVKSRSPSNPNSGAMSGAPAGGPEAELFRHAEVMIAEGKLDKAETLLREHLRQNPDSAGTLYRLGRVFFDRHDWVQSARQLEQSLRIEPRNDRAHLILGLDYYQLGRDEGAERHLLLAVEQNPEGDENQYMAGRYFYSKYKRSEALSFFYRAIRLNPENYKALHSVGLCLANLGHSDLAEHYYRRSMATAESQNVEFGQPYLDLADLLTGTQSSRVKEGELLARRAVEILPDSGLAYYVLGKALYRQEKVSEAVPLLLKSTALDPGNSLPHFLLAKIYQKQGRHAEARTESEIFHELAKGARKYEMDSTR